MHLALRDALCLCALAVKSSASLCFLSFSVVNPKRGKLPNFLISNIVFLQRPMTKPLTQITFDFSAPEQEFSPPKPVEEILLEKRPLVAPRPPAEEKVFEEPMVKKEEPPVSLDLPIRKSTRGRRSLKEISQMADLVNVPADEVLFQKQYYSIGEVAGWFQVNQSLLRYWESEFSILKPRKNRKGDRFFRPEDVKNLQLIYDLLRRRKFTIEGAKDFLKNNKKAEQKFEMIRSLEGIRGFLLELKANL